MVTGRWKWNPPHPYFWFFSKNVFFTILGWTGQKMRYWIWGPVGFKPEYLLTYLSYLNSDKCILILIEFPLIWYIRGLSRSKFDWFSRVWKMRKMKKLLSTFLTYWHFSEITPFSNIKNIGNFLATETHYTSN